jgi:hypothetical protein
VGLRLEDHDFEVSLNYIARPCIKRKMYIRTVKGLEKPTCV